MSRPSAFDWPHLLPATLCDLKLCFDPEGGGSAAAFVLCASLL